VFLPFLFLNAILKGFFLCLYSFSSTTPKRKMCPFRKEQCTNIVRLRETKSALGPRAKWRDKKIYLWSPNLQKILVEESKDGR
jgi:hypothetical protein